MDYTAFILILLGLQLICLFVGSQSAKHSQTQEDYFLAGKKIRFFPLMMTFLATQVGGGLILGAAEEAYKFGWMVLLFPLGSCLGLTALGLGIGRKLSQFQVTTVAQIFEVHYRSPVLRKIASTLSIVSLFAVFIAQIIASNKFMISLGVDNPLWFFLFWGIVIIYTCLGGLKAVVATDMIQAGFFVLIFFFSFGYALYMLDTPSLAVLTGSGGQEEFAFGSAKFSGWLLMPFLFMMIEQDMGQRCFAAESPKTVSRATLWAALATFCVSLVPIAFGMLAKSQALEIPNGGSVLMIAIQQLTSPLVTAFVSCAVLVAIISTADSLINAISSNLSQDFGSFTSKISRIRFSQMISAFIALLGIFCSFYFNNIVDLLVLSYELSVSCLFVPIVFALYKKQGNKLSATLAILCGVAGFLLGRMFSLEASKEVFSLGLSLSGYCAGEWVFSQRYVSASSLVSVEKR